MKSLDWTTFSVYGAWYQLSTHSAGDALFFSRPRIWIGVSAQFVPSWSWHIVDRQADIGQTEQSYNQRNKIKFKQVGRDKRSEGKFKSLTSALAPGRMVKGQGATVKVKRPKLSLCNSVTYCHLYELVVLCDLTWILPVESIDECREGADLSAL